MAGLATGLASNLATNLATVLSGGGTPATILGANLVEYWDSTAGVGLVSGAVDTWTGQKLGIVLSAAAAGNRPAYGADSTYFLGKSAVQCAISGSKYLRATGLALLSAGSRPYIAMIHRLRVVTPATDTRSLSLATAGDDSIAKYQVAGTTVRAFVKSAAAYPAIGSATPDTTSHFSEIWMNAATGLHIREDLGTDYANAAVTGTLDDGATAVWVGCNRSAAQLTDLSVAAIMVCAAEPTTAQKVALREWSRSTWGTP